MRAFVVAASIACALGCGVPAPNETTPVDASTTRTPTGADAAVAEPFTDDAPGYDACRPLDGALDEGFDTCDRVFVGPYPIDAVCGSKSSLPCDFEAIVACCGALVEEAVIVQLTNGCATSIGFSAERPGNDAMASCIVAMIAGRRLDCRPGTTCLEANQSTVK